jgi:hypothetical protein
MELINLSPFSSNDEKSVSPKYQTLNCSLDKKKLQKETKLQNNKKKKSLKPVSDKDKICIKKKKIGSNKKIFKNE